MPTRVLVVSASMGAGHDGAARELVRRLQAEGQVAEMRDFLTCPPLHIGALLKSSYELQMRYAAWTYDLTYRLWYRLPALCPPLGRFMARLTGPGLKRWVADYQADVVVSTYPLTSVVLGQLRQSGRLDVPTINFITDFGVHPLWTHPGIDLNLAVHPRPAALAEAKSGRACIATGPMVSPRFAQAQDRSGTRAGLGLSDGDRAVLIVSGSWGVGDVANTFRTIAGSGRFVPIVVCGRDERLRERLSHVRGGRALGWTDKMPALMAAADALVENAGGLTAMEALSVGLPIISFRPIAGHGKENTAEMQAAGVSRVARTRRQLLELLEEATAAGPARQAMIDAGKAMFVSDPTRYVEYAAAVGIAGLGDRELLHAVGTGGVGVFDAEQLAAVANGVDFDPAEELRALLARGVEADVADLGAEVGADRLAPVVPIGAAKSAKGGGRVRGEAEESGYQADQADQAERDNRDDRAERDNREDRDDDDDDRDREVSLAPTGTDGADSPRRRARRPSVAVARMAALVAAVPLIWAALTSGVGVATAYGAGVAQPPRNSGNVAYIGVRLGEAQLTDPAVAQLLASLHASAVVDEQTAAKDPVDVQRLVSLGIDVANGGAGPRLNSQGHRIGQSPWSRANGDLAASHVLTRIAGEPVKIFVPGRRVNAFDLMACIGAHSKTVVPNVVVDPTDSDAPAHLSARHTYLVNGAKGTSQQLEATLAQISTMLAGANLSGAPLTDLA